MAGAVPDEHAHTDRQAARERAFRLLAGTVAALFLTFTALAAGFFWYDSASKWVSHTHQVRTSIANVLQALSDAESAQRGYLLAGDPTFLTEVDLARGRADKSVTKVEILTRDNAEQQKRIETLRSQMNNRLRVIDQTLDQARGGGRTDAIATLKRGEGIAAMAAVRRLVAEMDAVEARLEGQRTQRAATVGVVVLMALVAFALILGALFIKALRDINLDREAEAGANETLRELLLQRTLLLDEVNHRVKNSLQQIASVVRLQARTTVHEETGEALGKTLSRIMAVGRVHEQTYKSSEQIGHFDAGLYAETLAADLVASMGRDDIALETDVETAMLDMSQASPIALILNELITNALKYGCPEGRPGRLKVAFKVEPETYRLSVADAGPGLPPDFSLTGKKSLGVRAIQALARQLDGELLVDESPVGAAFSVRFPRSTP